MNHPIRIIIGFPLGGGIDIVARVMAPKLSENLGQQIVVDNCAGAGGLVGTELAAKAPPDEYTVFFGTVGNLSGKLRAIASLGATRSSLLPGVPTAAPFNRKESPSC